MGLNRTYSHQFIYKFSHFSDFLSTNLFILQTEDMRLMTFKYWLARACRSVCAFLCQWSTTFPSSHCGCSDFTFSQDSTAIGSCYKDGCWHVKTGLLSPEIRTTAWFSVARKHLSDAITNVHS